MKMSEVTVENMAERLRIDDVSDIISTEIEIMMESAKSFIESFTGLTADEVDSHEDITQAFFILVADMFENRNLYNENKDSNLNKAVECILRMHSINLI